jgi:hypothetical protein
MHPEITDPTYRLSEKPNLFERMAARLIVDKRDIPFVKLNLLIFLTVIPMAFYLYLSHDHRWWIELAYVALAAGYFQAPYILMLHNTSHRPFFRAEYRWLKPIIPWVIGPFFGLTPETYYSHHIGMHHLEENLEGDLSSTMRYQRDSIPHFLHYFGSFFTVGLLQLLFYMKKKKRKELLIKAFVGELSFYVLVGFLLTVDWRTTLVVFLVPFCIARFGMMAGNWAQHSFIDRDAPGNSYKNSITCINTSYNRRCYNDGYHIGHHLKSNRHWTDMPKDFLDNREKYVTNRSIVFQNIDYFGIWFLLMTHRYDKLASHFVQLGEEPMSQAEVIALLKERTRLIPIPESELDGVTLLST